MAWRLPGGNSLDINEMMRGELAVREGIYVTLALTSTHSPPSAHPILLRILRFPCQKNVNQKKNPT